MDNLENRRPLRTRSAQWAALVAAWIGRKGLTPNAISVIGIGFAALAAAWFLWWPSVWGLVAAACAIQLRLLCNMLDRMDSVCFAAPVFFHLTRFYFTP